jgi:flagellar motility protein MotE (MotC chaperone)
MNLQIPAPRLLPATICVLAMVLAVKSTELLRAAILRDEPAALFSVAWAASTDTQTAAQKAGAKPGDPAKPDRSAEKAPASAVPPKPDDKPATVEGPPPVTDSERAVLLELRDRRRELEVREATLTARESMLAAAETKLSARVDELQGLQKKLEALDANHRQQEDVAWQGLVKVYETMKPRDAAAIFNDLGMQVLLAVVDRMKEAKAAAILAAMTPDKAREVTMQLAQLRSRAASVGETGDKPDVPREPGKAPGSGT